MAKVLVMEPCPFHEHTILYSNYFIQLFNGWVNNFCWFNFTDIAFSLLFFDGVINPQELELVLKELLQGRIFYDCENYFIDVTSKKLGIRRVILSSETLFILDKAYLEVSGSSFETLFESLKTDLKIVLSDFIFSVSNDQKPLSFLFEIAVAFYSTRLSGPMREWFKGELTSRVLSIEALARHKLNQVQRIKHTRNYFHRTKKVVTDDRIRKSFTKMMNKTETVGSAALRIRTFQLEVTNLLASGQVVQLEDYISAKYALFLCEQASLKALSTIYNCYLRASDFINFSSVNLNNYEEYVSQDFELTLDEFREKRDLKPKEVLAITRLLKMVGSNVSLRSKTKTETIQRTRPYVDYLSPNELIKLDQCLVELPLPELDRKHVQNVVRLAGVTPLRAEDIASLRACDIEKILDEYQLVISSEATGTKKSANSNRVVVIPKQVSADLSELADLKRGYFKNKKVPLFANVDSPNSFEGGYQALELLSRLMTAVSGAENLGPHSFRIGVITALAQSLLSVQNATSSAGTLKAAIYELFVFTGHGDFTTMFEEYVCGVENLRRSWVDTFRSSYFQSPHEFLASVFDLNDQTIRKYLGNPTRLKKYVEKNTRLKTFSYQDRIENLTDFVTADISTYSIDASYKLSTADRQHEVINYRIACIEGLDETMEANLLRLPESEIISNNDAYEILTAAKQVIWKSTILLHRKKVSVAIKRLLIKLGTSDFKQNQLIELLHILPKKVNEPWLLNIEDFNKIEPGFFDRINSAGFDTIFSFSSFVARSEVKQIVELHGPVHYETQKPKKFAKGTLVKIKFVYEGTRKNAWPRVTQEANSIVTLFFIGFITLLFQDILCQKKL